MVREITVIKKPREDPIIDKPINFPALENLHLDLMENKRKLKKNLPPVQIVKKKPAISSSVAAAAASVAAVAAASKADESSAEPKKHDKTKEPEKDIPNGSVPEDDDADMLEELGATDGQSPDIEIETEKEGEVAKEDEPASPEEPEESPPQEEEDDPYAGLSPEEREVKEKEEYIWRFNILRKQHKARGIPVFNEHDDLGMMKTTYERTVREIHLESSVESYRTYLIGGFMVMEFVCINWAGIDLAGFTSQQMVMMDRYDRLLIELGERSYNRWGMNLPVEVRLIGFILLQAGLFYLGKIIADKAGSSVAELFRGITGQQPKSAQPSQTYGQDKVRVEEVDVPLRKKMKGPSIKAEDIQKMTEEEAE